MRFHPKVTAGMLAGAAASLIVGELARHGVTLNGDEASALTVLLSFAAGYFAPADDGAAPAAPLPNPEPKG